MLLRHYDDFTLALTTSLHVFDDNTDIVALVVGLSADFRLQFIRNYRVKHYENGGNLIGVLRVAGFFFFFNSKFFKHVESSFFDISPGNQCVE